jgi:predicted CoA-binding protein
MAFSLMRPPGHHAEADKGMGFCIFNNIAIGARCVWMQEGVAHPEAAERGRRAGLLVVMDTCILKEHVKRFRLAAK